MNEAPFPELEDQEEGGNFDYSSSSIGVKTYYRMDISLQVVETIREAGNFYTMFKFPGVYKEQFITNCYTSFVSKFYTLWLMSSCFTSDAKIISKIEEFFDRPEISCWHTAAIKTNDKQIEIYKNTTDVMQLLQEYIIQLKKDKIYDPSIERFRDNPARAWEKNI
jgi:hypothetical protein